MRLWQVLPLGPTGYGDSPYQLFSAFAGNPLLISPDLLVEQEYLDAADLARLPAQLEGDVDYASVIHAKFALLDRAFEKFDAGRSAAFESFFDQTFREHYQWIALFVLVGATLLWLGERRGTRSRGLDGMVLRDAVTIGAAQALALFPGASRSGITIAAGLLLGLKREAAARFSFLMAVPVIAGAGIWKARTLVGADLGGAQVNELIVGIVTSAMFGFVAIAFLLRFLRTNPTTVFIAYRIVLAAVIVVAWLGLWDR